jgi:hypothetical protein
MAKDLKINTYRMKKTDLIRCIQRVENNLECYGTSRVDFCNEKGCLWRSDCMGLSKAHG